MKNLSCVPRWYCRQTSPCGVVGVLVKTIFGLGKLLVLPIPLYKGDISAECSPNRSISSAMKISHGLDATSPELLLPAKLTTQSGNLSSSAVMESRLRGYLSLTLAAESNSGFRRDWL